MKGHLLLATERILLSIDLSFIFLIPGVITQSISTYQTLTNKMETDWSRHNKYFKTNNKGNSKQFMGIHFCISNRRLQSKQPII